MSQYAKQTIDDKLVTIKKLGAKRGTKIAFELLKLLKEPLIIYYRDKQDFLIEEGKKYDNIELINMLLEENISIIEKIADHIFSKVDPDELFGYLEEMLENGSIDDIPVEDVSQYFAGEYLFMIKVFIFCVKGNFANFFSEKLENIQAAAANSLV